MSLRLVVDNGFVPPPIVREPVTRAFLATPRPLETPRVDLEAILDHLFAVLDAVSTEGKADPLFLSAISAIEERAQGALADDEIVSLQSYLRTLFTLWQRLDPDRLYEGDIAHWRSLRLADQKIALASHDHRG